MRVNPLQILCSKKVDPATFMFDQFWLPGCNIYEHLTQMDINELHRIATSVKLSSNIKLKYQMIDQIMRARDFKRLAGGTNRVVYKSLNNEDIVFKIAVDRVGMQDNPREFENQNKLKPYCSKMFSLDQSGVVACCERVLPILNPKEFALIADDVFDIIVNKILGEYVIDDIGASRFMNWGVRRNFGPVLLDYPYLFELDGSKLFCTNTDPITGIPCGGQIDYDDAFDNLICTTCGKVYPARDLESKRKREDIRVIAYQNDDSTLSVSLTRGDEIITKSVKNTDYIIRPKNCKEERQ